MTKLPTQLNILHKYLESGLVPVRGFSSEEIKDFRSMLDSLSFEDRRRATRKFRKKWRKLMKSLPPRHASELVDDSPGFCAARRRRVVHRSIICSIAEGGDG